MKHLDLVGRLGMGTIICYGLLAAKRFDTLCDDGLKRYAAGSGVEQKSAIYQF